MYLSKIEINGFKSFANHTVLEFTPAVTAVVGPNGSGKSNIIDAIRWVTGEQSAKNLRGKKTQDVIFSGSASKPRSNMAEVSLHLNNDDKRIELDYSTVIITRRLYRTGESEYLINKNKARLQDIVLLLAKANFGQKSYGIVSQGMTDYILTCSPRDRKLFFDEAAGVKHHQIKRDQALNKLDRSQENLAQGELTLKEIEPRLRLLQRQVDKLNKRKEIEVELRDLQAKYYSFVWGQIESEKKKYQEIYNGQDEQIKKLEKEIAQLQNELNSLAHEESQQNAFNSLKEEFNTLTSQKNKYLKELSIIKGKLNLEYVKTGQQNIAWLENKKEELKEKLNETNLKLAKNKATKTALQKDLEQTKYQLETFKQDIEILQNNISSLEKELNTDSNSSGSKSYKNISITAILGQKNSIPGIYGTLEQLGRVKKSHQTALAVAVGSRLNAVVVENETTAIECIKYLKQHQLSPLTFLPLTKLNVYPIKDSTIELRNEEGVVGLAVDLIDFESQYTKAFEFACGSTLIVEDAETARYIGINRERMITLEGDVFEKSGAISGGHRSNKFFKWDSTAGNETDKKLVLKQISDAKNELTQKISQAQEIKESQEKVQVELKVLISQKNEANQGLSELENEIKKIEREINEGQLDPGNQDEHFKNLRSESSELENKLSEIEKQILEVQQEIDSFNLSQDSKKKQIFDLQENMRQIQSKLDSQNHAISETNIYLAKIETRQDSLKREIDEELEDFDFEISSEEIDIETTWSKIKRLKNALEAIGNIDPETIDEYEKTKERFDFINQQVVDLNETIKSLDKLIEDLDKIIKQEFKRAFKEINEHFNKYFKILFEGGNAELKLIQNISDTKSKDDDEDGEEAENKKQKIIEGLEITATPPGKKIKNLESLSGGEKSMAALALVCAVIAYNPPPFVILDEADAALDEANTQRFSEIIEKLNKKTQFIVVTHNRVTMEKAETLYGITMNSHAISKIISISLADAQKSAAR